MLQVLIVDDDKHILETLSVCLETMGCEVTTVATADAALAVASHHAFDLAFVDLRLGETSGLDLIAPLLATRFDLAIIMLTAYGTLDTAVEAIRSGAQDYLSKPFALEKMREVVQKTAARQAFTRHHADLAAHLRKAVPEVDLETTSPLMRTALDVLLRAAPTDLTVLLRGESGTGKGVLARLLHARSKRTAGPFVLVHSPNLSEDLLVSELFGHVKGAFTGAVRDQVGLVETADGGTLFLDEIGELSPVLQTQLLRFLQDKQFERLGEHKTRRADVRVVAATNRDLQAAVRDGRFREDLLYRLNAVEVHLPPLRERPEDLLRLTHHLLHFFAGVAKQPTAELSPAAERALVVYPWPGNLRELRSVIERAVLLWPAAVIEVQALPEHIAAHVQMRPYIGRDFPLAAIEREHISRVHARTRSIQKAARILGIDATTLRRKHRKEAG